MVAKELAEGQMVVCVDGANIWGRTPHRVVRGQIYIIRGFSTYGTSGLYLEELIDPPDCFVRGHEVAWRRSRFRPVKPTSIEIFRKLVAPITGEKVIA